MTTKLVVAVMLVALTSAGCERAGRKIDTAAQKTGKAVKKAGQKTGQGLKKAGEKVERAFD
ncbi:MAG TPA: hypothetical protein VM686_23005 [Polyangiaceae bacterium]|nr:hypothetical protein [Polyangiaceae bacterium]